MVDISILLTKFFFYSQEIFVVRLSKLYTFIKIEIHQER